MFVNSRKSFREPARWRKPHRWLQHAGTPEPTGSEVRLLLRDAARVLNVSLFEVPERIRALQDECQQLRGQLQRRRQQGTASAADLVGEATDCQGVKLIVAEVAMANSNLLRQLIDQIRKTAAPCVVLLGTREDDDKVTVVAGVSREVVDRVQAGHLVREIAPIIGGGGGGKPDLAQAGGKFPEQLEAALERARAYLRQQLGG